MPCFSSHGWQARNRGSRRHTAFRLSEGRLFRDYYGFDIVIPAVSSMLSSLQHEFCARNLRQSFSARAEPSTGGGEWCRVMRLHPAVPRTFQSMSFEDTLRMVNGKAGNGKLAELNLNLIFMRTRLFLWPRACSRPVQRLGRSRWRHPCYISIHLGSCWHRDAELTC